MSTDGDTSKRLSDALDQIFSRSVGDERESTAEVADEPYVLPEIVPATEEVPTAESPTLPARNADVGASPTLPARGVDAPQALPDRTARPAPAPVAGATQPGGTPAPTSAAAAAAPPPAAPAAPPASSWSDHLAAVPSNARGSGLRAPGRRPRVRRVTRVLRHIDPWSTFKVALLFSLVTYLVALTSGVLLWQVADSTGTLDNVERWFTQFGWETFELQGGEIFRNAWVIGLFGVVAMTGGLVLLATIFNLVSDIIGGIRLTVLEEEVVERTISSTRRYVVRQGPAAAGAAALPTQDWDVDDTDEPAPTSPTDRAPHSPTPTTPATELQEWSVDDD